MYERISFFDVIERKVEKSVCNGKNYEKVYEWRYWCSYDESERFFKIRSVVNGKIDRFIIL